MASRKEKLLAKFKEFDADKNGKISEDEAYNILHAELGFSKESTARFFRAFDKDRNLSIDYEEFVMFYYRIKAK